LFRWTTAGFWAWVAFGLYFVLNPVFSVLQGNLWAYEVRLLIAGGIPRGLWILMANSVGITVFFVAYLRSLSRPVTWRLSKDKLFSPLVVYVMAVIVAVALYSLLAYRTGVGSRATERIIAQGRFVGQVTGYGNTAHIFLFVPVAFLLLSESHASRFLGWVLGLVYILLSLPHAWSRFVTVSMLLLMSLVEAVRSARSRAWILLAGATLLLAATLQVRGHQTWGLESGGRELIVAATEAIGNLGGVVGSGDTAMLATWYLDSYVRDELTGYDYGITVANYMLTGWIPYRILPEKYFMIDWLHKSQPYRLPPTIERLLFGAKSSLLGSFYANGGIIAVGLLMWIVGVMSRRLDGMLAEDSPVLVRAIGISWLSMMWMVWGSDDYWGLMVMGILLIPGLVLWVVAPKHKPHDRIAWPAGASASSSRDVRT
jgi:hypothetical protein